MGRPSRIWEDLADLPNCWEDLAEIWEDLAEKWEDLAAISHDLAAFWIDPAEVGLDTVQGESGEVPMRFGAGHRALNMLWLESVWGACCF